MRSHKFKVKKSGLPKRICQIDRLLSFDLAGKLGDESLEIAHNLEDLDVCVPVYHQNSRDVGP